MILLGNRVIVKRLDANKMSSLVIVAEVESEHDEGEILSVGDEANTLLQKGKRVLYHKHVGHAIIFEGQQALVMPAQDVVAVEE